MLNNETKCYECTFNPSTCMYKCRIPDETWEFVSQFASEETRNEFTLLALKKAVYDLERHLDDPVTPY